MAYLKDESYGIQEFLLEFRTKNLIEMRRITTQLLSVIILLSFGFSTLKGQDAPINYFALKYIKVDPQNETEFIRAQLEAWKKIHQKRIDQDLLNGWYLLRVVSPAGTSTDYNYITVEAYENAERLSGHFDGYGVNYSGILGPEEISLALRTPEISNMTYEEVWRTVDQVLDLSNSNLFRYQVFNSMKLRPGVDEDEYQRIEREYWKPMHEKRIENGNMKGWGIYTMIIPGGTERDYHWATIDFYDEFVDYLKPTDGFLEAIHGEEKAMKYIEETDSKRDLLKAEIRELVDFVSSTVPN